MKTNVDSFLGLIRFIVLTREDRMSCPSGIVCF